MSTPTPHPTTEGYRIHESVETYDGPRRVHRQIWFHVYRNDEFLKSFKRREQAERLIKRLEQQ